MPKDPGSGAPSPPSRTPLAPSVAAPLASGVVGAGAALFAGQHAQDALEAALAQARLDLSREAARLGNGLDAESGAHADRLAAALDAALGRLDARKDELLHEVDRHLAEASERLDARLARAQDLLDQRRRAAIAAVEHAASRVVHALDRARDGEDASAHPPSLADGATLASSRFDPLPYQQRSRSPGPAPTHADEPDAAHEELHDAAHPHDDDGWSHST